MTDNQYLMKKAGRYYTKPINMLSLNRTPLWKMDMAKKQKNISRQLLARRTTLERCPICHSKAHSLFVEVYRYPYHECKTCGHIFSSRPPTEEAISDLYKKDGSSHKVRALQSEVYAQKKLYNKRIHNVALPKVEFIGKIVKKKGKWVDVGAGVGDIVISARRSGWKAVGLESDADHVQFAHSMGVELINAFIDKSNAGSYIRGARLVSLFNVLEHAPDPEKFLGLISRNLAKGALVVIEVPRHPSISSFSVACFPEYAARHIYPPDHLHIFTEKSLELILDRNGLKPQAIWLFGQDIYEVFNSMSLKGGCKNQGLFMKILSSVNGIQGAIDKNNLSDTMLVLAKK